MAENLKTLRRRIRSIRTTRQITRAMEMVSASKLRRALTALQAIRPYAAALRRILARLAESEKAANHPLFGGGAQERRGRSLLVVITSDRGLCGSFNANLLRAAEKWLREEEEKAAAQDENASDDDKAKNETSRRSKKGKEAKRSKEEGEDAGAKEADSKPALFCIGRKGLDHFRRLGEYEIVGRIVDHGGQVDQERASELADELTGHLVEGRYASIYFAFTSYVSNVAQRPKIRRFLPLDREELAGTPETALEAELRHREPVPYIMEPNATEVFERLVPKFLRSRSMNIHAESFTSEHAARMMAMNNATANSDELIDHLTLRMNQVRQGSITREMLEIVGGAEALKD